MPLMAKVRVETGQRYIRISMAVAHLAIATSVASLLCATPSLAGEAANCVNKVRGAVVDDCLTEAKTLGENTEKASASDVLSRPFVISVDGESVAGGGTADTQRRNDVALDAVDIQVKFDGLDAKQILFVSAERSKDQTDQKIVNQSRRIKICRRDSGHQRKHKKPTEIYPHGNSRNVCKQKLTF